MRTKPLPVPLKKNPGPEAETTFHYCWRVKISFKLDLYRIYLPKQFVELKRRCSSLVWPIFLLTKTSFDPVGRVQSSLRLPSGFYKVSTRAALHRTKTTINSCQRHSRTRHNPPPPNIAPASKELCIISWIDRKYFLNARGAAHSQAFLRSFVFPSSHW